jgi:DNA primase
MTPDQRKLLARAQAVLVDYDKAARGATTMASWLKRKDELKAEIAKELG